MRWSEGVCVCVCVMGGVGVVEVGVGWGGGGGCHSKWKQGPCMVSGSSCHFTCAAAVASQWGSCVGNPVISETPEETSEISFSGQSVAKPPDLLPDHVEEKLEEAFSVKLVFHQSLIVFS